jgi:flagellar protein FlaG
MRINNVDTITATIEASTVKPANDDANRMKVSDNKEISEKQRRTDAITRKLSELSEFEKRELPISEKVVLEAIERANKAISIANRRLEYAIHDKTKDIIVKVINTETEEIIREIPPEKMLDMVACIWEMIGIIVDERR